MTSLGGLFVQLQRYDMLMIPDSYVRRSSSTIPFGYRISNVEGYLEPIEEELKMYKEFHDAILENNIIEEKFNNYRKVITTLENENMELKKKLKLS